MSNLTDLGLVEVVSGELVKDWPARADALLNALAAIRWRDTASNAGASAALATVGTDVAGLARSTVTLDRQCRVKVSVLGRVVPAAAASSRYAIQPAYNAGAFNFASYAKFGPLYEIATESTVRQRSGWAMATILLAAGTYTFYAAVQRAAAGSATDTFDNFSTIVEVVSLV